MKDANVTEAGQGQSDRVTPVLRRGELGQEGLAILGGNVTLISTPSSSCSSHIRGMMHVQGTADEQLVLSRFTGSWASWLRTCQHVLCLDEAATELGVVRATNA
jgi:hypothetical protein